MLGDLGRSARDNNRVAIRVQRCGRSRGWILGSLGIHTSTDDLRQEKKFKNSGSAPCLHPRAIVSRFVDGTTCTIVMSPSAAGSTWLLYPWVALGSLGLP